MVNYLTTVNDVKNAADLTNEYSDDEIGSYITDVEYDLFTAYPNMKKYSQFTINSLYDNIYYVHNRNSIYRPYKLTNVRKQDTTVDAKWVSESFDDWTLSLSEPVVTVPDTIQTGSDTKVYKVDWVPYIYHRLATLLTYQKLLVKGVIISNSDPDGGPGAYLQDEITNLQNMLKSSGLLMRSSVYSNYNPLDYITYDQHHQD